MQFKLKKTKRAARDIFKGIPRIGVPSDLEEGDIITLEEDQKQFVVREVFRNGLNEEIYGIPLDNGGDFITKELPVGAVYRKLVAGTRTR